MNRKDAMSDYNLDNLDRRVKRAPDKQIIRLIIHGYNE
jgi:hypothetical protein